MAMPAGAARYTFADFLAWGEDERIELVDGEAIMMAPPSTAHQLISGELFRQLANYLEGKKCRAIPAPFAVNLDADDKNWVEPDISVICDPSKLTDRGCSGAPDFIVEVVSPSSRRQDYNLKNSLYATAGVREYWIVDPAKERTTVYHFEEDAAPTIFSFDQDIPVGIFPGLKINIAVLLP